MKKKKSKSKDKKKARKIKDKKNDDMKNQNEEKEDEESSTTISIEPKKFKEKNKHFPCILKKKIRNINIDHISQLLNNIKTSRKRENNFMKIFDTNPKSSSNSRTQSKSNTSRDKSWKKDFLIFNSSRNYNKKCSLKKIWKKQIFNLTQEKWRKK